ncbi:hypothetical protein [Streptomyces sp. Da 82-17]|uniref:hypothetical protein n=1 Tax=Streptomyces sp. Da 82-17 TaxID=3377116 RepID=UPI0038D3DB3C
MKIGDGSGGFALGCVHHGTRMYASLATPHAIDHTVHGSAAAVIRAAAGKEPFFWRARPPVPEPTDKELAEGLCQALCEIATKQTFGLLPETLVHRAPGEVAEVLMRLRSAPHGERNDGVPAGVTNVFELNAWLAQHTWESWVEASQSTQGRRHR